MSVEPLWTSSLGWALVHFLWQGLVIGMASAVLLVALRNARPQARYLVACLALLACLLLPGWEFARGLVVDNHADMVVAAPTVQFADISTAQPVVAIDAWRPDLQARLPWIVSLWSIGAALLVLRMALGLAWVGNVRRAHATDADWQRRLDRIAVRLGLGQSVRLHLADGLDGPVAAGWWRPMVIVPTALLAQMSPELLEALLAHELAHIRRHDYLVNLAQSAVEALLFYHPVVWWLSRQIRIEREQIADDLAAQAVGAPRHLALALQELDRFQLHATQLAPAATGGNLMSRIQRLIRPNVRALTWQMALPILGLTAVCLAAYANTQARVAAAPTIAAVAAVEATPAVDAAPAVEAAPAVDAVAPVEPVDAVEPASKEDGVHVYMDGSDKRQTYALVRAGQDGIKMIGDWRDHKEVERLRKTVTGDFLWVRRDDRRYLIQDPALLAQVEQAWKPTDAVDVQMEALNKQMEPHNQAMEALNRQMEALQVDNEPNNKAMESLEQQLQPISRQQEALGAQMEALGRQMAAAKNDDEREALDQKMEALQTKMDALQRQMQPLTEQMEAQGRQIETGNRPMEELGHKMELASRPMEDLGRKMEVLGKQMEQLSAAADQKSRSLIDHAIDSGAAIPVQGQRAD
jgi:beta-lactamase regulating signal transducer with metallopeptidase domain/predicted  nucleic acid-binding Zn-ribbon protein